MGALTAIIGTFPVAAVVALLYRFPFPLAGYSSGFGAMVRSPVAVAFYGVLSGGFIVLALLGAVIGKVFHSPDVSRKKTIVTLALFIDIVVMILLAMWDKIYGPW